MPTVREYEAAMERNPSDTEAFVALRKAYRQAQKHDRLVTLYEARAQAIEDNAKAGELFYLAAELRIDQLGDAEGAEADLVNAVDRDPSHIRAAARLKDIYREQGRTADYMTMLEMEAAAVARTRDPARIAELEAEMSQLFLNHFARLERAVRNPQKTGKLAQEHVRSIESARKIYRALGDYRAVVRLYELELEGTQDARRRADLLLGLGRVLGEKLEELDAAAQRLAEVVRLRPRDEKALELLAGVYANPNWIGADGVDRAAAIYYQIARRRQEASDTENAIAALRRALTAVPVHAESSELLERVYYDARRFQELDRFYRERIGIATVEPERIDFLYKRAQLAEGELEDVAEAQRVYNEISLIEPAGGPASEKLVELYLAGQEYAKLAELRERQLGAIADPQQRAHTMLELAALYRDRLGDRDQAAVYLHAVLEIEPENQLALGAYAEHFREKGDWAALADLLEFSFERARLAGIGNDELLPRLEEIATVSEKQLGDAERAIAAWQRAEEIAPTYSRAREAQRRLLLKSKSWDRLAALLEREAAAQTDAGARTEILRRAAQIYREKLGKAPRAIEIYKDILKADPTDAVSMRAVVETYEREGDFVSLAQLLREQIDRAGTKQERVGLLRRVLVICDERTGDLAQGQWAANEVLTAVPGDRDTLTRLERILERAGKPAELVQVLDQHTKHAANPDEKLQILHRIAGILRSSLQDPPGAAAPAGGGRAPRPGRRQGAGGVDRDLLGAEPVRGPGPHPGPAGRTRRRRSGAAGRIPAPAGPAGRGPDPRPEAGAKVVGAAVGPAPERPRNAGFAGAHRQQPVRLDHAGPDSRASDADRRGAGPRGRHRPAARADLRREAARHRRRRAGARAADLRGRSAQRRGARPPARLLRERRGLAARRQGGRAAAVPDRGAGAARSAGDGAGRAGPRQAGRRQEGDHHLRARAGDGPGEHGRAARGRRPLRQDRRSPATGVRAREAAGARDRSRRTPRADAADRDAARDPAGRSGARLRVVPARVPGDARRRGPAAGRSGGGAPRPVRGADSDLRGRARAGQRADRTARRVAEDRARSARRS